MGIDKRLDSVYKEIDMYRDSMGRVAMIDAIRELEHRVGELEDFKAYAAGILGPQLTLINGGLDKTESD